MEIRRATFDDLDTIAEIYRQARCFMRQQGNLQQWTNGYPQTSLIETDIKNGNCFVCVQASEIVGVFCYFPGPDPTYSKIQDGAWPNAEPYGVIHRIAVAVHRTGVADACYRYALAQCKNLRIDTHQDNLPMQRSLAKNGFRLCGIIHLANGDPRIAYQKTVP